MARIRKIKRPVYRKTLNGELFLKIFPDEKVLMIKTENLFTEAEIIKSKEDIFFKEKDNKKKYITARKKEFTTVYRTARKVIRI